ncbi:MAG: hypothetical protein Q4C50_04890 [Eubacteriales bacterium]|nr:hypothetical protein [Eubacteriales bacterium]
MGKQNYDLGLVEKLFTIIKKAYDCEFSSQQMDGMLYILDRVYSMMNGIHVLAVPCGIGKTTVIKVMVAYSIIMKIPMLIITDRLERLAEYTSQVELQRYVKKMCGKDSYKTDIVNLSQNTDAQASQTLDRMIVLMSLQKFNGLATDQRDSLYHFVSTETRKDRIVIIDEALISHDVVKINNNVLGRIEGTLRDTVARLENTYDELQNAINVFSGFACYLRDEMARLEQLADNVTLPFVCCRDSFTGKGKDSEEEAAFLSTMQQNMSTIMGIDGDFKKSFGALLNILNKEVTFFVSHGKNDAQNQKEGNRYFLTKIDYKNRLPKGASVWILDGTADIDIQYDCEKYLLKTSKKLHRDLSNMTIGFHTVATNSTLLKNRENRDYIQLLWEIIREKILINYSLGDVMISTYKDKEIIRLVKQISGIERVATYGDITGRNDWKDCHVLVKTGILRKPMIVSLMDAIEYYPYIWDELTSDSMSTEEKIKLLNSISVGASEKWRNEIDTTIVSCWMVDLVQEIYRLCIRNYNCTDLVTVHIYSMAHKAAEGEENIYTKFYDAVESYFSVKGTKIINYGGEYDLYELRRKKRKSAKGNGEPATYGKIMRYLEEMPSGTVFTLGQLAEDVGIKYDTLRKEKKRHKEIADMIDGMKTGKRIGKNEEYCKP